MRILSRREIPAFYDGENHYEVENILENKFYIRCEKVSPALKDLIKFEKVCDKDHFILTKKVSLSSLKPILSDLGDFFLAEIEEDI